MKGLLYVLIGLVILSGCAVSKDSVTARQEEKRLQKAAEVAMVKKAVESRQYIIRMDKIFVLGGAWSDLVPDNNFLIIDGELATVSLGYLGRSFGSRPISGINFHGNTVNYILDSDQLKGIYNIKVRIRKDNNNFDFFISIGASGYCSVTVNNSYIQSVSYKGTLVPISRLAEYRQNNNTRL